MNSKKPALFTESAEDTDVRKTSDDRIDRDRNRKHLRELLLTGSKSGVEGPIDASYFEALRNRINAKS